MAPAKKDGDKAEKDAKLTPDQSAAMILDYLRKQNRPYSATDISANLKNRVTKAAAAKLLKDMHERSEIEGKATGKQIVYHAIQDDADEMDVEKLQDMGKQTTRLCEETTALKAEEKELRSALSEGAAQVPLTELKTSVTALELKKAELAARLAKLQGGNIKPVSAEERAKVAAEHKKWIRCAGQRKKIRKELWLEIQDKTDRSEWEGLKEDFGFESL